MFRGSPPGFTSVDSRCKKDKYCHYPTIYTIFQPYQAINQTIASERALWDEVVGCPNRPKSELRRKPTVDDGLQTYHHYMHFWEWEISLIIINLPPPHICNGKTKYSELKNWRCQIVARRQSKIAVSRSLQSLAISIKNWQRDKTVSHIGQPPHLACQC